MFRQTKDITNTPFALEQYVRTLLPKKGKKGQSLPSVKLRRENVEIDSKKVAKYAAICGFNAQKENVPTIFPHILAFPLHLELMLDKAFPFQIVGMVHINNTITSYKPIPKNATLTLEVYFDEMLEHDKGKIVPIITKVYHYGELVWESRSENLKITKKSASKGKKGTTAAIDGIQESWTLDTYAGIRYAKVAGDINPIHLFPFTAKAFGFKRHIIHGMWTKARAIATLTDVIDERPLKVHVDFKLPVFLPAKVNFNYAVASEGIQFEVRDKNNEKPHLKGEVTYI